MANKVKNLFELMEMFYDGQEISSHDEKVQELFEVDERTLRRYLNELSERYPEMIVVTKEKQEGAGKRSSSVYKVPNKEKDVSEVLRFFFERSNDLSWLLQMINSNDPKLLKNSELDTEFKEHMEAVIKEDEEIFLFVNTPFETLGEGEMQAYLNTLKTAVKNHEYRKITYLHRGEPITSTVKCLKLVFTDNNWYLAAELEDGAFRFIRLAFIQDLDYAKNKESYQKSVLAKYADFFDSIQNAMTLNAPRKTATILARAEHNVSSYFKKGMKPFFPSQKCVKEREDGSVVFTVEYTQPLEILPFIKRWAPDLVVLEPESLRKEMAEAMKLAWQRHQSGSEAVN
jgi:predicted DNA-binding transcriptional regulator YafY